MRFLAGLVLGAALGLAAGQLGVRLTVTYDPPRQLPAADPGLPAGRQQGRVVR